MKHHRYQSALTWALLIPGPARAAYAAVALPAITDVEAISSPGTRITTAPAGIAIQVNGQNFGPSTGHLAIGGRLAAISSWSDNRIQSTVPQAPSYPAQGPVIVTTKDALAAVGPQFTITAPPPPPPSTTTTIGSWQVITFSATGTPTAITDGGALLFNGPNGKINSQPFLVPNIYAPNPAPIPLGTMTAGQNTTLTAAVEGLPAADGSRVIQCYGYAATGTPGETHAVQATVIADATGRQGVQWADLNPAGAYSSQIFGASAWGAVGSVTAGKGQSPTPYVWKSNTPSQALPKPDPGSGAAGPSFWDPIPDPLGMLADAVLSAVNSSGKSVGNQYSFENNGTGVKTHVKAFEFRSGRKTPVKFLPDRGGNTLVSGLNDVWDVVGAVGAPEGKLQAGLWVCDEGTGDTWYDLSAFSTQSSLAIAINNRRRALLASPAASYGNLALADVKDPARPKFTPIPGLQAGFGPNGPTAVLSEGSAVAGVTATSNAAVALPLQISPGVDARAVQKSLEPCWTQTLKLLTASTGLPLRARTPLFDGHNDLDRALDTLIEMRQGEISPGAGWGAVISYLTAADNLLQQAEKAADPANAPAIGQCVTQLENALAALVAQ